MSARKLRNKRLCQSGVPTWARIWLIILQTVSWLFLIPGFVLVRKSALEIVRAQHITKNTLSWSSAGLLLLLIGSLPYACRKSSSLVCQIRLTRTTEVTIMRPGTQRVIVINRVRYNVPTPLDSAWSYVAEWWNQNEYHKHPLDDTVGLVSEAEWVAIYEIQKAHLEQEPWLHVERASTEGQGDDAAAAMAHVD